MKASVLPGMSESPCSRYWITRHDALVHRMMLGLLEWSQDVVNGLLLTPLGHLAPDVPCQGDGSHRQVLARLPPHRGRN
jgi:hypothetical protein